VETMKHSEYLELYQKLSTPEDIDFLAENLSYDKEFLLVIYTQRVTRDATKRYYRVKDQAKRLVRMWHDGRSFVQIARKMHFPPTLTALMILEQKKITRKQFWKLIENPSLAKEKRLRRELKEVGTVDIVYSPKGTAVQYERGKWGEKKLFDWLDARGLNYRTEKQLRSEYDKTPDVLLRKPIEWNGSKNYWIESKASVGDPVEVRRQIRRQFRPYSEIFGDGIVVYWFGFIDDVDLKVPNGVNLVDMKFFERDDVIALPQQSKKS